MNKPVAWTDAKGNYFDKNSFFPVDDLIPLYTQDQLEEARKLGMQQERALWNLSTSTQEIMDTHPVKEHFEDEPQAEELHEIMQSNTHPVEEQDESFDRTASHMAGEYVSWTSCVACGQRVKGDSIHTCSPQLKQLTDEEIISEWVGCERNYYNFARAILLKASEK